MQALAKSSGASSVKRPDKLGLLTLELVILWSHFLKQAMSKVTLKITGNIILDLVYFSSKHEEAFQTVIQFPHQNVTCL